MHKGHSSHFPMERGVRSACSLSPYLYALFTCLLYDDIAASTCPSWAARAATLSVGKNHHRAGLALCHALRPANLPDSYKHYGMKVNPEKSQLIVQVKGALARRWLKRHLHRTAKGWVVELGTPIEQLRIPRVRQMVYLGVVASYGSFEQQSCMHRIEAATANRHRLATKCFTVEVFDCSRGFTSITRACEAAFFTHNMRLGLILRSFVSLNTLTPGHSELSHVRHHT